MSLIATVTAQGRLLEVKVSGYQARIKPPVGNKKQIKEFSPRSRVRLLKLVSRLDVSQEKCPVFVTLTFGQLYPTPQQSKEYMRLFVRKLDRRSSKDVSSIWRMEFQERGAPHFHLIVFGLDYIKKEYVAKLWAETIGQKYWDNSKDEPAYPFTRIEGVQQHRKLIYYVSKYVAKVEDKGSPRQAEGDVRGDDSSCGFNSVLYMDTVGRFWGIIKRKVMPFGVIISIVAHVGFWLDHIKTVARTFYDQINDDSSGFHIYMDNPENIIKVFNETIGQDLKVCVKGIFPDVPDYSICPF